jgi:hypothetical protein
MRPSFASLVGLLVASMSAASCAAADEPPSLAVRAPSPAAHAACRSSAHALCSRAADCSPPFVRFFFGAEPDCETVVAYRCLTRYEGPGAVEVPETCADDASHAACEAITDVSASIIDPALHLLSLCRVAPGTFEDGRACLRSGDCASTACAPNPSRSSGCGICVPSAARGEPCRSPVAPSRGAASAYCALPLACVNQTCQPPLAAGSPCSGPDCPDRCGGGVC